MEKAIVTKNINKKYKLYGGTKERILDLFLPSNFGEDFYALKDINFEAKEGDVIGFVGINGSGKSTLSNIIAGIVPATSGTVETKGQASLIAVASGLKGDLSGRENIELKLLMLGFNKEEIRELEPSIVEFAELERFIDQPVKSYSSGMKSRLGFAISVNINPDILIIDEALSVGDKAFAGKSFDKMMEFKAKGKTMIFVSHSIGQMKRFCEKILWLEFGRVKEYGTVEEVIPHYEAFLSEWGKLSKKERDQYRAKVVNEATPVDLNKTSVTVDNMAKNEEYSEHLTSFLAHIRKGKSFIYSHPLQQENKKSSRLYRQSVYFIRKRIEYQNDTYYLLSEMPSFKKGTIGWIKKSDLLLRKHFLIDEDKKRMIISGEGIAYSKPWGGENEIVIGDLQKYKNLYFEIERTEKVGKTVWYRGELEGKKVWIHGKFLIN
ncbi:teichoic acids export ABC transporter ATP-binding subunit TagH [Virgibacillus halodenitrificans]|uniref:teichoic acids export ABC transporter ATP-binding subunit TagH n=1 Tax=Virgibacillus halodenitrificans TaxID=1482 RepID=UPI002DB74499|nr:teichoic acids export ABC transporter ATP-binding subunit TagH [Virgibacillus halodenitrificans]